MPGPEAYLGAGDGLDVPDRPARSFVALPCPPGLSRAVDRAREGWRKVDADVKWADPAKIHLTLRFLGDAPPPALVRLHAGLVRTAREAAPVALEPGSTGAFPDWRRARVLWLGFVDAGPLERLAGRVEADARAAGFEPEERPFTPHLTLGRVRGRRGARRAVEAVRGWSPETGVEEVSEMILYRSMLTDRGAVHEPLARYPLGAAG